MDGPGRSQWVKAHRLEVGTAVLALVAITFVLFVAAMPNEEERAAKTQLEQTEQAARVNAIVESMVSTVRYEVDGTTAEASITMETPTGTVQNNIDVPLTSKAGNSYVEFTFIPGDFVYVSAQNSQGYGDVTCTIRDGAGRVISRNTASGGYSIATCKGQAP